MTLPNVVVGRWLPCGRSAGIAGDQRWLALGDAARVAGDDCVCLRTVKAETAAYPEA
jgi:hypothetical protein